MKICPLKCNLSKTYHLVVSFRPEDESKLTPKVFKEIELEFAKALGFTEHQRHAGVHKNTENLHLHVAYNMIHPERRTRHDPFQDYGKRDYLCRELEQKYGLTVDNGCDKNREQMPINESAKAFEIHTGQESFFSYVQRQKSTLLESLSVAKSWNDVHRVFFRCGLHLKPKGNGLVIQTLDGQHAIKASSLDSTLSKAKLMASFGQFAPPANDQLQATKSETTYTAAPLQKNLNSNKLYQEYQATRQQRQNELEKIQIQDRRLFKALNDKWEETRKRFKKTPMLRNDRRQLMEKFSQKRTAEFEALRKQTKQAREDVRAKYPYKCWKEYLQYLAGQGNETALTVLHSKGQEKSTIKYTSQNPAIHLMGENGRKVESEKSFGR